MRLVCPCCGAAVSAEGWVNDREARQLLGVLAALPDGLGALLLRYLALFRPEGGPLSWWRAGELIREVRWMMARGEVARPGKAARPCPPELWGRALRQLLGQRESLRRPLRHHGYLQAVAYRLAESVPPSSSPSSAASVAAPTPDALAPAPGDAAAAAATETVVEERAAARRLTLRQAIQRLRGGPRSGTPEPAEDEP